MLQYSSSDILPLIGDTIQEVSFYTAHLCPNVLSFLGGGGFLLSLAIWNLGNNLDGLDIRTDTFTEGKASVQITSQPESRKF